MSLSDCVSKDSSKAELLLLLSDPAYAAAREDRSRMTQAILPIDPSFTLGEEIDEVLDNEQVQQIISAIGIGIMFPFEYPTDSQVSFRMRHLRYAKIILATEEGEIERRVQND